MLLPLPYFAIEKYCKRKVPRVFIRKLKIIILYIFFTFDMLFPILAERFMYRNVQFSTTRKASDTLLFQKNWQLMIILVFSSAKKILYQFTFLKESSKEMEYGNQATQQMSEKSESKQLTYEQYLPRTGSFRVKSFVGFDEVWPPLHSSAWVNSAGTK